MTTASDIRNEFLGFYEKNGHTNAGSSPLVPQNDPTLMFVNSGMAQFKNVFTGAENRDYNRATTSQKCVRAGGKHNDLDNVGYTARHHTFFEMLGNFSFGDYFKEEAISFAWELISKNFQMPQDKLLITVHSTDEEAAGLWRKIAGFSDDRILRIPTDDNFWQMGDTGPCGPCSEIFYDQGDTLAGGPPGTPEEDGDRYLEFWNLVFMQYEQEPGEDGKPVRRPLPKPCIDTGMGLERMTALMQGKFSNYDIDLLRTIIDNVADLTSVDADGDMAASHRVIADHLRCASFLLADGVMPSNEGRGYVLRRIMRRGMRHAHLLGANEPLMHRLLPTLVSTMGEAFPELKRAENLIGETLKNEETRFKQTLDRGLKILDEEATNVRDGVLAGDVAFKLYDTYGFPVDLTADALKAKNIEVDMAGFEVAMAEQKKKARAAWSGSGDAGTQKLWFEIQDTAGSTEFLGYEVEHAEGEVLALVKDGKQVDKLSKGDEGIVFVNQTPFYGESGGQTGDTGFANVDQGSTAKATVTNTQKPIPNLFAHFVTVEEGGIEKGATLELTVDHARRSSIRANHSATHLLHEALRETLGDHVAQKGSLQDAERTRFDISQPVAVTPEQIKQVEDKVNQEIRANTKVTTRIMNIDDARETGAMALFGEKYDDEVRVVSMGSMGADKQYSVELCGGTHVNRTGDIGLFKIVAQSAVSAGVRRLEAVTGSNALAYYEEQETRLNDAANVLKSAPAEVVARIQSLTDERKKLEQEVSTLRKKLASGGGSSSDEVKDINGVKFIGKVLEDFPAKDLKSMVDDMKKSIGSGVIALIATQEGKASIVVGVTNDLTDNINAVDLVKLGAEALGGKGGGGRPDMAQAGGANPSAANDAVSVIEGKLG